MTDRERAHKLINVVLGGAPLSVRSNAIKELHEIASRNQCGGDGSFDEDSWNSLRDGLVANQEAKAAFRRYKAQS